MTYLVFVSCTSLIMWKSGFGAKAYTDADDIEKHEQNVRSKAANVLTI